MATDEKCFKYSGPLEAKPVEITGKNIAPPSESLARAIVRAVISGTAGRYQPTSHFRKRMAVRNFDVMDVEYVVRKGRCIGTPEYSLKYDNHKFRFRADVDGVDLEVVLAISAKHDYRESPLVILVTGCWKNDTGIRKVR